MFTSLSDIKYDPLRKKYFDFQIFFQVGTSDGLAGLDINDFAKVVVIDEHFAENVEGCAGDFEEVSEPSSIN